MAILWKESGLFPMAEPKNKEATVMLSGPKSGLDSIAMASGMWISKP